MHFSCRLDINFDKVTVGEMKVKGTESRCMLEEYVNDNYYVMFHRAITAAVTCTLVLDLT